MYYVLRTHGEIDKHWGFTCVAICPSKNKAKEAAKELLRKEPSKDKYVIAKATSSIMYIADNADSWIMLEDDTL